MDKGVEAYIHKLVYGIRLRIYFLNAYTQYLVYASIYCVYLSEVLCAYGSGSMALSWLTPMMMTSFVLDKLRVIAGKGDPRQ